jgi:hypothetical protein
MLHAPRGKSEGKFASLMPGRPQRSLLGEDTLVLDRRTNKFRPSIFRHYAPLSLTRILLEAKDKEIFNLKLQLHFLNEKLCSKVLDHIDVKILIRFPRWSRTGEA